MPAPKAAKEPPPRRQPSVLGDVMASRAMLACSGLLLVGAIVFVMVGLPRVLGVYIEFGLPLPATLNALMQLPRIVFMVLPALLLAGLIAKEVLLKSGTTTCIVNAVALMIIFAAEALIGLNLFTPLMGMTDEMQ